MKKTIHFFPQQEELDGWFDAPVPAKKLIPEWYKQQSKYIGDVKRIYPDKGVFNATVKSCMPVFDIITAGYILTSPVDIFVDTETYDGYPVMSWSIGDYKAIENHNVEQIDMYKVSEEYHKMPYKFMNNWIVKTPKGYSSIFMSPAFRDDSPLYCLPGIVDTDKHPMAVNFPFFLRKDFSGIIPKGTPLIQIIPFKRETWRQKTHGYDKKNKLEWKKAEGTIENRYKKYFRTVKEW